MEILIYLKDLYLKSFREAIRRFRTSLSVILGVICLLLVWRVSVRLMSPLGMAGGFALAIIEAACITYYLSWIRDSVNQARFRFKDLKYFDFVLFQSVISVLFIIFLFQWAVRMLITGMDGQWFFSVLQLLIVILLNSLPEVLYISRMYGWLAVQESFNFTQKNWIEWYLPILVMLSPLAFDFASLAIIFSNANVMLPTSILVEYPSLFAANPKIMIISIPLLVLFSHFFMLFRASLFQELEGSNRRQRIFRAKSQV